MNLPLLKDINFEGLECVESGEYGNILKYNDKICIKRIKYNHCDLNFKFKRTYIELLKIEDFKHENLIQIYDCCEIDGQLSITMEYFESKDLNSFWCNSNIEWENIKVMLKSIVKALIYLKKYNLIHRDIKTENILVQHDSTQIEWNTDTIFKLCDYDFVTNSDDKNTSEFGTFGCCPPEFWFFEEKKIRDIKQLNFTIDVWSIGMLIIDTFLCNNNGVMFKCREQYIEFINDFTDFNFISKFNKIDNGSVSSDSPNDTNYKDIIQNHYNYSKVDEELLFNLLTEPEKRWSLEEIFEHLEK